MRAKERPHCSKSKPKPSDAPQPRPLICINAWAAKWSISNLVLEQTDKAAPGPTERERDLIALVGEFVRELHPQRARLIAIHPSSRIERDLGIDSLGRTELIMRIERAFHVRLPNQTFGAAETIGDLGLALEQAGLAREHIPAEIPPPPDLP